jgi:hypothetical protein
VAAVHTCRFDPKISAFSPRSVLCFPYDFPNNKRLNGSTIFVSVRDRKLIFMYKVDQFYFLNPGLSPPRRVLEPGVVHVGPPSMFHVYLCSIWEIDNGPIMAFSSTEKSPSPTWQRNEPGGFYLDSTLIVEIWAGRLKNQSWFPAETNIYIATIFPSGL